MLKRMVALLLGGALALPAVAGEWWYQGEKSRLLVDVRTPAEFAAGHLPGAINVPLDQLDKGLPGVEKSVPVLLYCRSGMRSARAKALLQQQGYQQIRDGGGMRALAPHLQACPAVGC